MMHGQPFQSTGAWRVCVTESQSSMILNYATKPRYEDLPIYGDPMRTARKGPEDVFGYAAFDRYKTTNSAMTEWSRGNALDMTRTWPGQPLGLFPTHGGKVHGHWDRCWFTQS